MELITKGLRNAQYCGAPVEPSVNVSIASTRKLHVRDDAMETATKIPPGDIGNQTWRCCALDFLKCTVNERKDGLGTPHDGSVRATL
jgi:hypothetical protein